MQALPNLPRATSASANGINDLGQVVSGSGSHAVLWNKGGDAENLGVVPGQTWSTAFAINGLAKWLVDRGLEPLFGPGMMACGI